MKKLLFNLHVSKGIFAVLVFINLVLPLYSGQIMKFNLFQLIIVLVWSYGLLSHLGFFKTQVSDGTEGKILYEPNTPIVQIGILRLIELIYFLALKREVFNWKVFILLIVWDVFYIIFLLLDKSRYVFEMEEEDELY